MQPPKLINLTPLFRDESLTEEDILREMVRMGREEPNERIVLNGTELDLSVNTRGDLIHFLRAQAIKADRLEKELRKAKEMLFAAAISNGGKLRITRETLFGLTDETEMITERADYNNEIIIHVHTPTHA